MLDWKKIETVFLDMDGTLLDLNFDNYFWQHHVPQRYAEKFGMDVESAKQELFPKFRSVEGTMDWYCVDYWTGRLGLDIALLKQEVDHLIAVHPHVTEFLDALREHDKRVVLLTNAHQKSLSLKMEKTQLGGHFDRLICTHDIGLPKEQEGFWEKLQQTEAFEKEHALLIDDSLPVLRRARAYGVRFLLAVYMPDTKGPERDVGDFDAVRHFSDITPV
jgi:putative hydrolase of the HAD superfamily